MDTKEEFYSFIEELSEKDSSKIRGGVYTYLKFQNDTYINGTRVDMFQNGGNFEAEVEPPNRAGAVIQFN